ncbi:MAG TPA: hypothetical protein VFA15_07400, partial [Nitrososphaera sp.]|nr:hypothetical protein [Nitrososphaera sp.]
MKKRFDDAAEVITSDGEKIGQLSGIEKDSLFVYKKGLLTDEQFKIPASSISEEASTPDSVRLKLSEEELKHGREFLQGAPNSDLVHGDS